MFNKTVNDVLKSFNKMIEDLKEIEVRATHRAEQEAKKIQEALLEEQIHVNEAPRASSVRGKIEKLVA